MYSKQNNGGFTLIELLVTLVVLAIVLAIGVPSLANFIENNRVTSQSNTLLAAVNLARSEAVKRGVAISIQGEPGGFADGWCVIAGELDGCQNARDNNLMIKEFPAPDGVAIDEGGIAGITYNGRGYQAEPGANVRIELEPPDCPGGVNGRRVVSVSLAGRASINVEACD